LLTENKNAITLVKEDNKRKKTKNEDQLVQRMSQTCWKQNIEEKEQ